MTSAPASPLRREWAYLAEFANEQLPRYTSYPPANRFTSSVGSDAARVGLCTLPANASLSLYLHIPFCQKLCWYCGCHTSVPTQADPVDSYLLALKAEIAAVARQLPGGVRVSRIHFGGGSPDILTPAQIAELFGALRSAFTLDRFAEIAAELDPRNLSLAVVEAFADQGLSRASLGVQVLSDSVQQRINRVQSREQIELAIARLRSAGVHSLNVDLMYGLPGQTREDVIETAMFAATQDVDRVAVFGYAHVPWMKKHQKSISESELPSGEERFRQAEAAATTLERAGYLPIGFDHFAAPGDSLAAADRQGRLRRNFQGYTDDEAVALIGFGASAISSLPNLIYQNTPDTSAYRVAQAAGASAVARGVVLTPDDQRIGRLIERLLCEFEADLPADLRIAACSRLVRLQNAGLVELHRNHLTITARGRPYVRTVGACFDPEFAPKIDRHSLAV
jgi:oxygen-independent coproporphyrinogen III oxidase